MSENKWFYFYLWLLVGLSCAGNALHYFIGGEAYVNSNLRNVLVVAQIPAGIFIIVYAYKRYRQKVVDK